jgi:hypothetical protein
MPGANLFNPEPTATAGAGKFRWKEVMHGVAQDAARDLETFSDRRFQIGGFRSSRRNVGLVKWMHLLF